MKIEKFQRRGNNSVCAGAFRLLRGCAPAQLRGNIASSATKKYGTGVFLPIKGAGDGKPQEYFSIFSCSSQFLKTPPSEILPWQHTSTNKKLFFASTKAKRTLLNVDM
jgi:hypothetical protein